MGKCDGKALALILGIIFNVIVPTPTFIRQSFISLKFYWSMHPLIHLIDCLLIDHLEVDAARDKGVLLAGDEMP